MTTPAAINLLPPEALAHVFDQSGYTFSKDHRALLRLTAVCKHWRDVIHNHPHFWTSLDRTIRRSNNTNNDDKDDDDDDDDGATLADSLDSWFKHAGDSPRNLSLRFDRAPRMSVKEHDLFRYLRGTSRWRSLVLKCGPGAVGMEDCPSAGWIQTLLPRCRAREPDPASGSGDLVPPGTTTGEPWWPALEEFEVHAASARYPAGALAFPLACVAPSLQKFAFTARAIEGSLFSVFADFSWANLTHFDLWTIAADGMHPAFIIHVLEQAPGLEDLRVVLLPNRSPMSSQTPPAPIRPPHPAAECSPPPVTTHQNLKHLGVHVAPGAVMCMLKRLQLPNLTSLDIATRAYGKMGLNEISSAFVDVYRAFVARSGCEMKTLHLQWVPRNVEEFNETIGGSRTLESVELEDFGCYGADSSAHPMFGFCKLLQGCKEKGQDPLAGLKKLSYVTYGFGVKLEEGEEDFEVLRSEPINWWRYKRFSGMKVSGAY